jgi:hypothetical protein
MRAHFNLMIAIGGCFAPFASTAIAFEGRIHAVMIQGSETNALLYTVGTNSLRVEMTATNWPNPVDILDRNSGLLTLLFPHNRSFVRLKPAAEPMSAPVTPQAGTPAPLAPPPMPMPPGGLPPGVGLQSPTGPGAPGMPSMPTMPMPMMARENLELQATGQKTNILGFACAQYELKQRGEILEVWATDQLLPYQPYLQNQPHRFGPQRIEEQWPGMLTSRKLFPLLATLRYDNGAERFRFEIQSFTSQKLTDEEAKLFQPPAGYFEIQPLPF